ncbi:TPA: hypothetical protein P1J51_003846 [Clostridioides difficile]|nr:hypothetical protein [Clostridioides difficile]HDN2379746.1 hypothetical protein [Clostridioides difficile]
MKERVDSHVHTLLRLRQTDRQTDRQTSKFCPFFNSINNKQNAQIIQL